MPGSHTRMKQGNRARILRLVREGEISRAELARKTGLTRAAVTGLVDELLTEGLLCEGAVAKTAMGRHPTMLRLEPEAYYAAGVDISRQGVKLCVVNFVMEAVSECAWDVSVPAEAVLAELAEHLQRIKTAHRLLGVGVSAPGPVDVPRGRILAPTGLEPWHGFCVDELQTRLEVPVSLEKDTNALAIAEKSRMTSGEDFLVLLADHGLGAGFVHNGMLFSSSKGYGCEIGHVCIDVHGEPCSCGSRGCAELYTSVPATVARARRLVGEITWQELCHRALQGEEPYRTLIEEQAELLAVACVGAVNLLEPAVILLEGELTAACPLLSKALEARLRARCFSESGRAVCVCPSVLSKNARAMAAAATVLENYFNGG